jgi:hypothetical protein
MTKSFLKTSLLSLTASTILVSGLNALSIQSAAINLTDYNSTQIVYDTILTPTDIASITQDAIDGNLSIFVKNANNEYNISIAFDHNFSKSAYFIVTNSADIKTIRGNTQDELNITTLDNNIDGTVGDKKTVKLVSTLGASLNGLAADKWNLITMPFDKTTNAKEIIKSGKVSMIWGWDRNTTQTDDQENDAFMWVAYPDLMEPGMGYWIRTRANVSGSGDLSTVIASDYNATNAAANSKERNVTASIINSAIPNQWELLGVPSTGAVTIVSTKAGDENNDTKVWFEDLLNAPEECYFVSIYHWDATSDAWINDTEGGATTTAIPQNAGMWVKQRLCKDQ